MLSAATPLTPELARRWVARRVPSWAVWGTVALWVGALVVAAVTDDRRCTPADPSVCGPDQSEAWWLVVLAATPVLLLWLPLIGCFSGIAFTLAEIRYDEVPAAKLAFAGAGLACAVLAVWFIVSAQRQTSVVPRHVRVVSGGVRRSSPDAAPFVAAAALVVVGVFCLGWYRHATGQEAGHVEGHVVRAATVTAVDENDYTVRLRVPARPAPRVVELGVRDPGQYRKGGRVPVRLDPEDPTWVRLVAEPLDLTYWRSGGVGALGLAVLVLGRQLVLRRTARSFLAAPVPALAVRVVRDAEGELVVVPAGDGRLTPVARLRVAPSAQRLGRSDVRSDFGRFWRGESEGEPGRAVTVEPAVLLGRLHDRGIVAVATADGVEVPRGPLRLLGGGPPLALEESDPRADELADLAGVPLGPDPAAHVPDLPVVARPPMAHRVVGVAMILVALIAVPAVLLAGPSSSWLRALAVALGGSAVLGGTRRCFERVTLGPDHLRVVSQGRRAVVPWSRLHGVRQAEGRLSLAWEPDVVVEVGPFDGAGFPDPAARAGALGSLMMTLRDGTADRGGPSPPVITAGGPAWVTVPVYAVLVGGAWLRLLG